MSADPRPKILVLAHGSICEEIMSDRAREILDGLGTVEWNESGRVLTQEEVAERVPGCTAVLTSYGAPRFDDQLLAVASDLRVIGHAGGSIKRFILPPVFERGIAVTHAAITLADSVAEWALTLTLMALRQAHTMDRAMQAGEAWLEYRALGARELYRKRVGVIGASMAGRALIKLLKPFDPYILVYDPYLSDQDAEDLGVRHVDSLDGLMATSDVITNHAPTTPETSGMVNARLLGLVKDGALFVNTARADAVDYDALLKELQTGRITAALDVFPLPEPLAEDSPFRELPNVILSPHVAGFTVESRLRAGETVAEEFVRFFAGEPLRYGVTADMLATMG